MAIFQRMKARLAERRETKGERLRKRAEAKAYRVEMKRSHETKNWGGGGG